MSIEFVSSVLHVFVFVCPFEANDALLRFHLLNTHRHSSTLIDTHRHSSTLIEHTLSTIY